MSSIPDPTVRSATPGEPADQVVPLAELLKKKGQPPPAEPVPELGGRKDGPEPTRYGDWEKNGRCIDF